MWIIVDLARFISTGQQPIRAMSAPKWQTGRMQADATLHARRVQERLHQIR